MAIEIIEMGVPRQIPPRKFRGRCDGCDSLIECSYEDLAGQLSKKIQHYWITCPVEGCNQHISMSEIAAK